MRAPLKGQVVISQVATSLSLHSSWAIVSLDMTAGCLTVVNEIKAIRDIWVG